ncbi:MAG: sodium-translocating pyrophosphatase [Candidatus Firestonebacteria bacterium]
MEANIVLPPLGGLELGLIWFVLLCAFIALLYGLYLVFKVIRESPGSKKMIEVASAIEEGAMSYLWRQGKVMIWFVIIITLGLFLLYYYSVYNGNLNLSLGIALAFFAGVFASYGAGYVGMSVAVKGNVRTANAALTSFSEALRIAFQAGTVSGMFTVGFGLLGATVIFLIFRENAMKVLVGFGFGGCLAALFMRVGGGIYTKAADVGADLVGKIEVGIPEDDPRNAATIADNVGDNVGDCAGMAADVFESYEVTLVAAIILASATLTDKVFINTYGKDAPSFALKLIIFPLLVRAVGVFSSIIGTWMVKADKTMKDPMKPITTGYVTAAVLSILGVAIVNYFYLPDVRFFLATSMGIVLALLTLVLTNYFTHPDKRPVTETAISAKTGPATLILNGMAEGLESTVWAIVIISGTILSSLIIFGFENPALAAYGIALTGLGLLTTTGFILAMDTYGPITDNAHGIFEMSGIKEKKVSRILSRMDAIGNTTKALTKGLAIATAVIAAISLFRSFIDEAKLVEVGIQVNLPQIFIGLLIGGAVPFLFSSFALKAVGRAAFLVVQEVRKQFKEHPGIMKGKEKPEYGKCVEIVTAAAQRELIGPAILAIATPTLVAFTLGAGALGGYLAGAILTGQLLAVYMANTGGLWDNAKKKIEDGFLGGKGTDCHKASVIGDTVGDPYKDTAGPALNPMIKVMNLVGILLAPIAIKNISIETRIIIAIVCISLLGIAIALNRKGSLLSKRSKRRGRA